MRQAVKVRVGRVQLSNAFTHIGHLAVKALLLSSYRQPRRRFCQGTEQQCENSRALFFVKGYEISSGVPELGSSVKGAKPTSGTFVISIAYACPRLDRQCRRMHLSECKKRDPRQCTDCRPTARTR